MADVITAIYDAAFKYASEWHAAGLGVFELPPHFAQLDGLTTIQALSVRLIYHNYQIWHLLEDYKSPDSNRVLFVYDGGIRHNKLRNNAIEALDKLLCSQQVGKGKLNSETIGSIIDRVGIWYLKKLHEEAGTGRHSDIMGQIIALTACTHELYDEMLAGTRWCAVLDRSKNF